jgi:class 3 adenylate cyclase/tetratricopeptide (TPR) repeat protein
MQTCPNCGEENPDKAKFCLECATPLVVRRSTLGEERKVVSILFVDLVGFTSRSHDADPEDVRAALGPYHALLKREIERFGGSVEKFIGDAVMAVFGAPVAHEDDAERAVRTALRITAAIAELNVAHPGLDLSVRAVVNSGEGLISLTARTEAGEGMVTGDVVNTASRLQNVAPVNGVVVGELTYRATQTVIEYRELEPVMVKGKPDPIPLWHALSAKSRLGVDADVTPVTPFIGRDYELSTLKLAYGRAVREASPQLVTVVGEPGVGKSRLIAEFSSFIDDQHELVAWRQGRSLPYGEGITFWALGEIIKAHAGILESDSSDVAAAKLEAVVTSLFEDAAERPWFVSRLFPLIGLEGRNASSPQKEESFTAWRRFLEAVAEEHPLILVFEDLHWADPSLLEFIEHLVDWVTGVPMFVVCTARPELYDKHPNWGGGKRNITIVSLSPLDDSETAQLIASLLAQAVLPDDVQAVLLDRAGGNPLYAEEFIRMLSDRGILSRQRNVVTLDHDADIPVPESVQALIAARIDTLSEERKSLLQDASVAGKVFWSGAVAAVAAKDPNSVRQDLHQLAGKEFVRPSRTSSMEGQQEFSFWHALIRDVCYGQIPRVARARKHQAMAAWIEATAERLDDVAEVLVHHYSTALELARASGSDGVAHLEGQTRSVLVMAAARAMDLDAARALSLYRSALDLLDRDDPETPQIMSEAGTACRLLGRFSEAQHYYEESIAGYAALGDQKGEAAALIRLQRFLRLQGDVDLARKLALRSVELLQAQGPGEDLSVAYGELARFQLTVGAFGEAIAWAEKALDMARRSGGSEPLALALESLGLARGNAGDPRCFADLEESLKLRKEAHDQHGVFSSYNNLVGLTWLFYGPAKGLEVNAIAREVARTHGYIHPARWAQMEAADMLFELGKWDEVLQQADELSSWAESHGAALIGSAATLNTAVTLFHRGKRQEALALEPEYLPFVRNTVDLDFVAPCLAFDARMQAEAGGEAAAVALIEEFGRRTEQAPAHRARYAVDVVRALCTLGRRQEAAELLPGEEDITLPLDRHALVTAQAVIAEASGSSERAVDLYEDATQRWKEYGFLFEEGQALLGAGRSLIELGRKAEAAPKLERARSIFLKLGAMPLLEETDRYLEQVTAPSPRAMENG